MVDPDKKNSYARLYEYEYELSNRQCTSSQNIWIIIRVHNEIALYVGLRSIVQKFRFREGELLHRYRVCISIVSSCLVTKLSLSQNISMMQSTIGSTLQHIRWRSLLAFPPSRVSVVVAEVVRWPWILASGESASSQGPRCCHNLSNFAKCRTVVWYWKCLAFSYGTSFRSRLTKNPLIVMILRFYIDHGGVWRKRITSASQKPHTLSKIFSLTGLAFWP